ncbi:MFS transporter [Streptomyces sp. AJS327]|uniref:MFS transporter n=1 Tax=Streptomyces sp. AJS327 TaxID=2545265 RepID=UPI0015DDFA16|nr:MFS transporter [Streptomyces sp. AJS327]MBA0054192.1 MFS transporter [Streptomyces sp. AJS327]
MPADTKASTRPVGAASVPSHLSGTPAPGTRAGFARPTGSPDPSGDTANPPAPGPTPSSANPANPTNPEIPASPPRPGASPASASAPVPPGADGKLGPGEPGFGRMRLALFAAGLSTFTLLYSTQAMLPEISRGLGATPGAASWTVSGATIGLALAVIPLSALSERFGRRRLLTVSLAVAVALALLIPLAPDLGTLIALRTAQGAAIAGVPASAMAYLADEVRGRHLVSAVGLFVAGNSVGGMSGRILAGWVTQLWGWRAALLAVALTALLCAVAFRLLAPAPRNFRATALSARGTARTVAGHLSNPLLLRLYVIGALFMTVFGAVYTVVGYRLTSEPFGLSQGLAGSIFAIYLVGTFVSTAAGRLHARLGRRGVLYLGIGTVSGGLLLSLADHLLAVIGGLVLITAGFFAGHCVASGAVSGTAREGRAQASGLYQMAYYTGSSLGGALGALAFAGAGWAATVGLALAAMVLAGGVTLYATRQAATARPRTSPAAAPTPARG